MSYKKEYKLEQITPMIHFQYNQVGATLRASEVKPQLDRFIRERCKDTIDDTWFSDKEKGSLKYKMSIHIPVDARAEITTSINKMYFGNMGIKDEELKDRTVQYKDPIELVIICFVPELLEAIDKNIKMFFVLHNFGKRASKGFGGFLVKGSNPQLLLRNASLHKMDSYIMVASKGSIDHQMNIASLLYSLMKTGINAINPHTGERKGYKKGYLMTMRYFNEGEKTYGNDKAYMKKTMFEDDVQDQRDRNADEYMFVRALLGLADHYEFRPGKGDSAPVRAGTIKIKSEIERFQSPVLIKIYKEAIYFLPTVNEIPKELCNQEFEFQLDKNEKNRLAKSGKYKIKTPQEFNLARFLCQYAGWFKEESFRGQVFRDIQSLKMSVWERK